MRGLRSNGFLIALFWYTAPVWMLAYILIRKLRYGRLPELPRGRGCSAS